MFVASLFTAIKRSHRDVSREVPTVNNKQHQKICLQPGLEPTEQRCFPAQLTPSAPSHTLTCGCSYKQWCWCILSIKLQRLWRYQVVTIQSHRRLVSHRSHRIPAGLPSALFPRGIFPIGMGGDSTNEYSQSIQSQYSNSFGTRELLSPVPNCCRA